MNCSFCGKEMYDMGLWPIGDEEYLYHRYHCRPCKNFEQTITDRKIVRTTNPDGSVDIREAV